MSVESSGESEVFTRVRYFLSVVFGACTNPAERTTRRAKHHDKSRELVIKVSKALSGTAVCSSCSDHAASRALSSSSPADASDITSTL